MDSIQALHSFWSSFGLKAYDESTMSPTVAFPYLTYNVVKGSFNEPIAMSASLWYKDTSWADITKKAHEIEVAIGRRGKAVPYDDGVLWVKRGTPFSQRMGDEDDTIRRIYINIEAEYISAD